jgi:tetratricopeptide (TPR) repeat protein
LLTKWPGAPGGAADLPDTQGDYAARPAVPGNAGQLPADAAALSRRAARLLVAVSIHREPADRNALLFQLGEHDWTAARAPDRRGPAPPYQPPPDLRELLAACVSAELLAPVPADPAGAAESWQVDTWVATRLHQQLGAEGRQAELAHAHRRAAEYWQWRAAAWPQDRRADIHDLLEARYHLFTAGDAEQASEVTQVVCAQLHAWGDLGREAALIQSTLELLPERSGRRASCMHELGAIFQVRGNHDDAQHCFAASAAMSALLRDYHGVARAQHSLGVLAQAQGDYRRAERHYRWANAAERRAGGRAAGSGDGDGPPPPPAAMTAADSGPGADQEPPAAGAAGPVPGGPGPDGLRGQGLSALADLARYAPVFRPPEPGLAPVVRPPRPSLAPVAAAGAPRRTHARALRRRAALTAAGAAAAVLAIAGVAAGLTGPAPRPGGPADADRPAGAHGPAAASPAETRASAAAWVAGQVSRAAVIACDPAMCAALQQRGVPAGDLLALGPGGPPDPLASNVVIATAAVRSEFGARLTAVYAPVLLAAFGAGPAAIQVRAMAPDGAAAYLSSLRSDQAARRLAGTELLRNGRLAVSGQARVQLGAGRVDARLLATLATLADIQPLRIVAFADAGPAAAPAVPFRLAEVAPGPDAGPGWSQSVLRFLAVQQAQFRPAAAGPIRLPGYTQAVRIEYASPSPLGLLPAPGSTPGALAHG